MSPSDGCSLAPVRGVGGDSECFTFRQRLVLAACFGLLSVASTACIEEGPGGSNTKIMDPETVVSEIRPQLAEFGIDGSAVEIDCPEVRVEPKYAFTCELSDTAEGRRQVQAEVIGWGGGIMVTGVIDRST